MADAGIQERHRQHGECKDADGFGAHVVWEENSKDCTAAGRATFVDGKQQLGVSSRSGGKSSEASSSATAHIGKKIACGRVPILHANCVNGDSVSVEGDSPESWTGVSHQTPFHNGA